MRRLLRGIVRVVLLLVTVIVAIPVLGLGYGFLTTEAPKSAPIVTHSPESAVISERLRVDLPGYKRTPESTFLTYPEWSIVYAAREYAGFVAEANPSGFPYFAYVGRFWQDYAAMIRASAAYPFNFQNHMMLMVIGISHTAEHVIQSVYENTIGRLTSLAADEVEEDRYQAKVAAEYAAFLDQVPWYQFPYRDKRIGLWTIPVADGAAAIRSSERKLGFGLAYAIKQSYADLIRSGLSATSDPAALDIHVWADGPVTDAIAGEPDTRLETDLGLNGAVFVTKRYQVFTDMIPRLIERGVRFVEIGGNQEIMLTVLSNEEVGLPDGTRKLFSYPLPTDAAEIRTGIAARVADLHDILPELANEGARLEHVYDY